jgi:outer membrane lipoprotein carrier protein
VRIARLWIALLGLSAWAADAKLEATLAGVEARYNRAKTLEVVFQEQYTPPGRPHRTEAGTLMLRKPGRMRWEYSQPKGKLFISDGKALWLYTPSDNRAERMKLQESEDMRAPLAFLLGKLNFQKEFRNVEGHPEGDATRITAEPKSDSLPYQAVEFVVADQGRIREVKVTAFDKSILDFTFDQEKVNPPLDSKLFEFTLPVGTVVEATQ